MEITNAIRAKVFSQYLDTFMRIEDMGDFKLKGVLNGTAFYLAGRNSTPPCEIDKCKMVLKPLSAITDEDAMEVSLYNGMNESWVKEIFRAYPFENKTNKYQLAYREIIEKNVRSFQYLQSKGYDLPQYLLEGKTLHESGLAIYK